MQKKERERKTDGPSIVRSRENKIVKRRSRRNVANEGYDKVQPSHHSLSRTATFVAAGGVKRDRVDQL